MREEKYTESTLTHMAADIRGARRIQETRNIIRDIANAAGFVSNKEFEQRSYTEFMRVMDYARRSEDSDIHGLVIDTVAQISRVIAEDADDDAIAEAMAALVGLATEFLMLRNIDSARRAANAIKYGAHNAQDRTLLRPLERARPGAQGK